MIYNINILTCDSGVGGEKRSPCHLCHELAKMFEMFEAFLHISPSIIFAGFAAAATQPVQV